MQADSLITQSMLGKLVEEGVLICRVNKAAELNTYCIQARRLIKDSKLDKLLKVSLLNCSVNKVADLHAGWQSDQGIQTLGSPL